jgi:energy-coupling factor transport system permease protein
MMKPALIDPRIKLLMLLLLSAAALFSQNITRLLLLVLFTLLVLISVGAPFKYIWRRLLPCWGLILPVFLLQCLFVRKGDIILSLGAMPVLYSEGFSLGLMISLRLLIIFLSALIVARGNIHDYLAALTQCKIPYEIAFMVMASLRFLPFLGERAKDVFQAAQMRGTRLKKTSLIHKLRVYSTLMLPIVAGAIQRAEQMSLAMEARAFRAYPRRVSMRVLRLKTADLIYLSLFAALLACLLWVF